MNYSHLTPEAQFEELLPDHIRALPKTDWKRISYDHLEAISDRTTKQFAEEFAFSGENQVLLWNLWDHCPKREIPPVGKYCSDKTNNNHQFI